jgi:hypothetical protein
LRNRNPGNIRRSKHKWQGLAETQTDPDYLQFSESVWGIRALAKVLLTYDQRHVLRTIEAMISRWAPSTENDTEAYIKSVCADSGLDRRAVIDCRDPHKMLALVKAIIRHENGVQPYPETLLREGITRAGITAPSV